MLVKMDKKGRVTLPRTVRNQARLKFDSPMKIELRQREIILRPLSGKGDLCRSRDSLLWSLRHPEHVDLKKLRKIDLAELEKDMWYP
jgi:bifunctional DNA-binding transcriptional regulator/antitoxin component of YhaV-PrlF toxin-antitoxin module